MSYLCCILNRVVKSNIFFLFQLCKNETNTHVTINIIFGIILYIQNKINFQKSFINHNKINKSFQKINYRKINNYNFNKNKYFLQNSDYIKLLKQTNMKQLKRNNYILI